MWATTCGVTTASTAPDRIIGASIMPRPPRPLSATRGSRLIRAISSALSSAFRLSRNDGKSTSFSIFASSPALAARIRACAASTGEAAQAIPNTASAPAATPTISDFFMQPSGVVTPPCRYGCPSRGGPPRGATVSRLALRSCRPSEPAALSPVPAPARHRRAGRRGPASTRTAPCVRR